jgi:hypothetical protein
MPALAFGPSVRENLEVCDYRCVPAAGEATLVGFVKGDSTTVPAERVEDAAFSNSEVLLLSIRQSTSWSTVDSTRAVDMRWPSRYSVP